MKPPAEIKKGIFMNSKKESWDEIDWWSKFGITKDDIEKLRSVEPYFGVSYEQRKKFGYPVMSANMGKTNVFDAEAINARYRAREGRHSYRLK
jgi:hypothetical protein